MFRNGYRDGYREREQQIRKNGCRERERESAYVKVVERNNKKI